ncbi:FAR1-related sequence 5-like protein [Tanacetum coccineum]
MAIFTDQDHAMASALHKVMPNVHHGLCTWHIMQNAIKNVVNIVRDDCSLLKDFKRCMYVYGDEEKFEEAWETIIDYYNVKENHWLKAMFLDVLGCEINFHKQYHHKEIVTREAKKGSVQDYHGRDVHLYANVSATQRYRSLCPKLVKLASRASESQEACELVERLIGELTTQIESICFTEVKGDGDDCKVNESLSKDKDSKNSDVLPVGVKGLKKKAGKKGRPRMKSWVETQPKKKKIQAKDKVMASKLSNNDEVDSVANVIFEKVKGFFNCHPHGVMNTNNSVTPIDTN